MVTFGAVVLILGAVACFFSYFDRGLNLMTPQIFLSGVATIVGAILCVVGELVNLRTMIASRITEQQIEEIQQDSDTRIEE